MRWPARLLSTFLLFASISGARGQTAAELPPLPPDLSAELSLLQPSGWTHLVTLRGSAGYRDNILLSAFSPAGRTFGRLELEMFALSSTARSWEWRLFLNGDVVRYLSPLPGARGDQQWFLHGELGWHPFSWLKGTLAAQGYYQDMVLDLSETNADRVIAQLKVRGGILTGTTRFFLPGKFAIEPFAQAHQSDYLNYAGDYVEFKEGLRLVWQRDERLSLSTGWFGSRRLFRQRTEFTAGGRALPDTRLRFVQREIEVKGKSTWHFAGKWSFTVSASRLHNRDGASGYFDYDQRRGKGEAEWAGGPWTLTFSAELQHQDYLVQRVGTGIAPPPRVARNRETVLRLQRQLSPLWSCFAEGRQEGSRSNEAEFTYRAKTYLAGIERTF